MYLYVGNRSVCGWSFSLFPTCNAIPRHVGSHLYPEVMPSFHVKKNNNPRLINSFAISKKPGLGPEPDQSEVANSSKIRPNPSNNKIPQHADKKSEIVFPEVIPKRRKRGRRSEAAAVEDFVRDSLERTFASIRQQNSESLQDKEIIMKDRIEEEGESDGCNDNKDDEANMNKKKMVLEDEDPNWPLDADVGWGIRASDFFEKHPIKNVLGEDGVEIDWEGEMDDCLVKEINCLEWESFAFHPSPLIVLVFERYNRAADNWKVLKELEKAAKVYWSAKDRLPPRTVKIDINIERDLAYALKVRECPQLLFLRGNTILYREKEMRAADELVHMIAHFYYNAKKPSWMV